MGKGKGGKGGKPKGGTGAPGGKGGSGGGKPRRQRGGGGWSQAEEALLDAGLQALGLIRAHVSGDGNCLFATIAEQHLGNAHRHPEMRALAVAAMAASPDLYRPFLLEEDLAEMRVKDYEGYLEKMGQEREWGGNTELQALANALARCMVVHRAGERPYVLSPSEPAAAARAQQGGAAPFHLAYDGQHYDSIHAIAGVVVGVKPEAAAAAAGGGAGAGSSGEAGGAAQQKAPPPEDPKVSALLQAFSGMSLSRERAEAALLAARGVLDSAIEAIAVGGGAQAAAAEGAEAQASGAPSPAQQSDSEEPAAAAPAAPAAAAAAAAPAAAPAAASPPGGKLSKKAAHAAAKAPPRNKPCPCGSALPFKKCCASKPKAAGGSASGGGSGAPRTSAFKGSPDSSSLAATFGGIDV